MNLTQDELSQCHRSVSCCCFHNFFCFHVLLIKKNISGERKISNSLVDVLKWFFCNVCVSGRGSTFTRSPPQSGRAASFETKKIIWSRKKSHKNCLEDRKFCFFLSETSLKSLKMDVLCLYQNWNVNSEQLGSNNKKLCLQSLFFKSRHVLMFDNFWWKSDD